MKRFNGGEKVPGGYYWNIGKWDIATISSDEGRLEAPASERFLRLPLLVLVPGAALVSFLFVVFLPAIGFGLLAYAIAKKVFGVGVKTVREAAVTVAPGWEPGTAHLTGQSEAAKDGKQAGEALGEVKKEIDARREAEDAQRPDKK